MKKKILFVTSTLGGGGAERTLINILRYMDDTRYEVDLLLINCLGVYLKEVPDNVRILPYCAAGRFRLSNLLRRACRRLSISIPETFFYKMSTLRLRKYDVIISFLEGNSLLFHSLISQKGRMNVSWVHSDFGNNHWTSCLFKSDAEELSCYQKMDKIVCVSHAAKRMFRTVFDEIQDERISVIYNLIDRRGIERLSLSFEVKKERFVICFLGRLTKQADCLLWVARRFKDNGYMLDFWFVGDDDILEKMEVLSRELQVDDICRFWGFQVNPYPYLRASDLYVSTSSTDSFSLSIAEALFLGIPVVAAKTVGSCELLNNNLYGLLTDSTDESIYEGLKQLVDDPKLLHYYHTQALKRSEIFDADQTMNDIYSLFERK